MTQFYSLLSLRALAKAWRGVLLLTWLASGSGCVTSAKPPLSRAEPTQPAQRLLAVPTADVAPFETAPPEIFVQTGSEHPYLDRAERFIHAPMEKLERLFSKNDRPRPDPDVERTKAVRLTEAYLTKNEVSGLFIDVREYDPAQQWKRLQANKRIAPFWRYTFGSANVVGYTLLPGRVFRSDSYNPFTNTLAINSADRAHVLLLAGNAKFSHRGLRPGCQAAGEYLPLVGLPQQCQVARDVLDYARDQDDWELEKSLYVKSYGQIGSSAVGHATLLATPFLGNAPVYAMPAVDISGGLVSSALASSAIKRREEERTRLAKSAGAEKTVATASAELPLEKTGLSQPKMAR